MTLRERITEQPPKHIQAMRQRIQALYRQGGSPTQHDEVLSRAFEELALALEELQAADQELRKQQAERLNSRVELELECQRYKDLFNHAPASYVVTGIDGTIRQANANAAALLQSSERSLVGRALAIFVPEGHRRGFRQQIADLAQAEGPREWEVRMQSWEGALFDARLMASVLRGASGRPVAIYWLIYESREPKHATATPHEQRASPANPTQRAMEPGPVSEYVEHDELARRQFAFMAEVSPLLAIAQDIDATLMHVAQRAVPAIADGFIVDLGDPQTGMVHQLVVAGEPGGGHQPRTFQRRALADPGPRRQALRADGAAQGRIATALSGSLLAELTPDAELRTILDALGPTSAIVMPLQARGALLGSLTLLLSGTKRHYGRTDLALAEELARRIAIAIDHTRAFRGAPVG
jgi:PAS domain S-box-containing protein